MAQSDFVNFYRDHLQLSEEDQALFENSIEQPLPSAFRITPTEFSGLIEKRLEKYPFLHRVPFLTDVYSFELKSKEAEYKEFVQFLVSQADIGNIQRQEIVSFFPHLFMNFASHHNVLETCASPGSKTKNLLEILKTGLLISNDKTSSRVNILISEAMKKATSSFIVTQMDAMHFPTLNIQFDRICCDVPCSSDGTYRKNPAILPKWSVNDGISLSTMQLRILTRALDLLKEDGILVYSTCSLNPIENEYVVNAAIGNSSDYELINDFAFVQYEKISIDRITVRRGLTKFKHDKFEYDNSEMSKCFRILPHDQNTGGFFIAVIHKKVTNKEKKELPVINKLNSAFVEINEEVREKLGRSCNIEGSDKHFISFNKNFKNIYAVSDLCYNVLCNNPKLKTAYAGMKAFTASDLKKDVFRPKNEFLDAENIPCDMTLPFVDFKKLISSQTVLADQLVFQPKGLFHANVEGLMIKVCGFSGGNNAFLYLDDLHRKAYSELYLK